VPRPERALERPGELLDLDPGLEAGRVQLVRQGREDEVDAGGPGGAEIGVLVAWIPLEVGCLRELRRIDEQARDDGVAVGAGRPEQGGVAGVVRAHRRHEAERAARQLRERRRQLRAGARHVHGAVASARAS
jgi:hypothetical protein